jgi:hypothetical protein
MHKKGQSTDAAVLEQIINKPGITISEIAQNLSCTNGKIDGSVNRLTAEGKVAIRHNLKKGMLIKTVYPKEFEKRLTNQIQIPQEMANLDLWGEKAFVYALSRSTIGIAPQETDEWNEKAFSRQTVPIIKSSESVVLKIPDRLANFYQLSNSETSLSAIGDLIFVTVESILPVKVSANHLEKNTQELSFHAASL